MRRLGTLLLCIILLIMPLIGCQQSTLDSEQAIESSSVQPGKVSKFSIGASSPGGGFYMAASAISTVVNQEMKDKFEAAVEVTGASANNATLVHAGEIEMGMCATEVAWEAYYGKFDFEGKICDKIRAVMPGWGGVYMFITTADSGVKTLKDFNGKSYSGGPVGSSNEIITNRVFKLFDIKAKMMNLPNSDASRALEASELGKFIILALISNSLNTLLVIISFELPTGPPLYDFPLKSLSVLTPESAVVINI